MRAYRLAYDGTDYRGFQRQPDVPTVEDALLGALRALDVLDGDGPPPGYAAAGRTDAGVSALAQTVSFEAPDWLDPRAFNAELPAGVRAWAAAEAPPAFHATHDATERTYTYHLHAPDASASRARAALDRLAGEHDFHNLTPDETGTVRRLSTAHRPDGAYLVLTFRAPGFARHLVRRLVSLVAEVASGEADLDRVERVLAAAPLDGPAGVATAPAEPLVLTGVTYPGLSFAVDEAAAASARAVFEARAVERRTGARVAGTVRDGLTGE
ncbi:MAG: tRNA pseudouridine(38-40) synthase TruA [Haloarculaceae archaeon]